MKRYFLKKPNGERVPVKVVNQHVYTTSGDLLTDKHGSFFWLSDIQELFTQQKSIIVNDKGKIIGEQG